jgi:hypothetical protein
MTHELEDMDRECQVHYSLIQSAVDMSDKISNIGKAWFSLSGDVNRIPKCGAG